MYKSESKFYTYHQNNSGGYAIEDKEIGVGVFIIIEAHNFETANFILSLIARSADEIHGEGWFHNYCTCCGKRWRLFYSDKGDGEPSIFGEPAAEADLFWTEKSYYIHYLNGDIKSKEMLENKTCDDIPPIDFEEIEKPGRPEPILPNKKCSYESIFKMYEKVLPELEKIAKSMSGKEESRDLIGIKESYLEFISISKSSLAHKKYKDNIKSRIIYSDAYMDGASKVATYFDIDMNDVIDFINKCAKESMEFVQEKNK